MEFLTALTSVIHSEEDFNSGVARFTFTMVAYALGGKKNTTKEELIGYVGMNISNSYEDSVRHLLNDMSVIASESNMDIYSKLNGYESLNEEQQQEWINDHRDLVDEIEKKFNCQIKKSSDVIRIIDLIKTLNSLDDVYNVVYSIFVDTYGNPINAVTYAHTPETYIVWMNSLFCGEMGWYGNEVISFNVKNTTTIGTSCFINNDKLENVIIDDELYYIGSYAFYNCDALTEITIPDNVRKIGNQAFAYCDGLKKVTMPVDTEYETSSFYRTEGVETICYTKGKTGVMADRQYSDDRDPMYIDYTLERRSASAIKKVKFEEGITNIGDYAFYKLNNLTTADLPDTVTKIGNRAFYECSSLLEITDKNIEYLGESAFYGCKSLKKIPMGNLKMTEIPEYAFSGCRALEEITIPEGTEQIGVCAFCNCDALTEIKIPNSVRKIEWWAFASCDGLKKVTMPVDTEHETNSFYRTEGVETICYTKGKTGVMQDDGFGTGTLTKESASAIKEVKFEEGITSIGYYALYNAVNMTKADVPDTVTRIGGGAFTNCSSLLEITDKNIEYLGESAFYGCESLKKIPMGNLKMTEIPEYAFSGCRALEEITIPEGTERIGYAAFSRCAALTEIMIPDSVRKIGNYAFASCGGLKKVTMPVDTEYESSYDGPFYKTTGVETICCTKGKTGVMQGDVAFRSLTRASASAIKEVKFEEGITSIGDYALRYAYNMTKVDLPDTVTRIGKEAFWGCSSLFEITDKNIEYLGESAFCGCESLKKIPMGNLKMKEIPEDVFYYCKALEEITIPEGTEQIGDSAFCNCASLTEITIPDSVRKIEWLAFASCDGLKKVTLPVDTEYETDSFYRTEGVETICYTKGKTGVMQDDGFGTGTLTKESASAIKEVKFEEGITSIGDYALRGAYNMTKVDLPDTVTRIGKYAFAGCSSLLEITDKNIEYLGEAAFYGCKSLKKIPMDNLKMTEIPDYAFYYCKALEEITIPEGTEQIGDCAFCNCAALTEITIPEGTEQIGNGAFSGCAALTEITIPESTELIGFRAFYNCDALTEIKIPDRVRKIEAETFAYCDGLKKVTMPVDAEYVLYDEDYDGPFHETNGVEIICYTKGKTGVMADRGISDDEKSMVWILTLEGQSASAIKEVKFEEGITSIGDNALRYAKNMTKVDLPDTVTRIGEGAFYGCESLDNILIPYSVTEIGDYAFENVSNIYNLSNAEINDSSAKQCPVSKITLDYNVKTDESSIKESVIRKCLTKTQAEQLVVLDKTDYYSFPTKYDDLTKYSDLKWYEDSAYSKLADIDRHIEIVDDISFYGTNKKMLSDEGISVAVKSTDENGFIYTGKPIEYNIEISDDGQLLNHDDYTATIISKDSLDTETGIKTSAGVQSGVVTLEISASDDGAYLGTMQKSFVIEKAEAAPNTPEISMEVPYSVEKVGDISLAADWMWSEADMEEALAVGVEVIALANYCGEDKGNYIKESVEITIIRQEAESTSSDGEKDDEDGAGDTDDDKTSDDEEDDVSLPEIDCVKEDIASNSRVKVTDSGKMVDGEVIGAEVQYEGTLDNKSDISIPETVTIDGIDYKVTSLSAGAFKNNKKITSVTIGDNITIIGADSFKGCVNLNSVTIGSSTTVVGDKAFYNCISLKKIKIPNKVESIGNYAFYKCKALKKVNLPDKVVSIGKCAFGGCKKITTVTIGKKAKTIGANAFSGCSSLKSINIKSQKLKSIGKNAFKGIYSKATFKVPKKSYAKYKKLFASKIGFKKSMKLKKL